MTSQFDRVVGGRRDSAVTFGFAYQYQLCVRTCDNNSMAWQVNKKTVRELMAPLQKCPEADGKQTLAASHVNRLGSLA